MKATIHILSIAILTSMLSLLCFPLAYAAPGDKKPALSYKELKALLKTATTPAEHQQIAAYYREEAVRLTQSSKEHEELAEIYKDNAPHPAIAMESKPGDSFGQGASRCRRWGQLEAEQAKLAEALARLHEEMANTPKQK
jgi:hypothetical protein